MPQKKCEYEDYLNFVSEALELAKKIPRYFSKFSNKIYCNHQKMSIYILMQKFKTTTRGIISILKSSSDLRVHLGLSRVPVHTTIVRFVNKIRKQITELLGIRQAVTVAVDSTGFELETKSYYYRNIENTNIKRRRKRYMKLSIAIDVDKQLIMNYKIRRKLRHDTQDFKYLLKDLNIKQVVADKGYDDHKLRRFVINKLNALPIIPVRNYNNFYGYLHKHRKINGKDYHKRSKVETVFSVIKRKYGSILRNKTFATQKTELISKLIAYNLDRKLNYLSMLIIGLHQSL